MKKNRSFTPKRDVEKISDIVRKAFSQRSSYPIRPLSELVAGRYLRQVPQKLLDSVKGQKKPKQEEATPKNETSLRWPLFDAFGILNQHFNHIFSKPKIEISEESLTILIQDAERGLVDAQVQLGECYLHGIGVPQLPFKAAHYFRQAVAKDDVRAQFKLGDLYKQGLGVEKSFEKAFYYSKLAADQGDRLACFQLGKFYEEGLGTNRDLTQAFNYYQKVIDQEDELGLFCLAHLYRQGIGFEKSDERASLCYKKVFEITKELADQGDAQTQIFTAMSYAIGKGVEQSLEEAFRYYKLAAEQNDPSGLFYLGECYVLGTGVQASFENAMHYFQLAAKQNFAPAQLYLANFYLTVHKETEGVELLRLVSQSGFESERTESQYLLGCCFEWGLGVEMSTQSALHYYQLAAVGGDAEAQSRLGNAYYNGELGLEHSIEKSLSYYQPAADRGERKAMEFLANAYKEGIGVEKSPEKAAYYAILLEELERKLQKYDQLKVSHLKKYWGSFNSA